MKKLYIAPMSERVFPESVMDGLNPGGGDKGGGIIRSGSAGISSSHIICVPDRQNGLIVL